MTITFKSKDAQAVVNDESFSGIFLNGTGAASTMYQEYNQRKYTIESKKYANEADRLAAKSALFREQAQKAQTAYNQALTQASQKFPAGSAQDAFIRNAQSSLQKQINANKFNDATYARNAVKVLDKAENAKGLADQAGKFGNGATAALGALTMGSAWAKAIEQNDQASWDKVGESSSSFLGGLAGGWAGGHVGFGAGVLFGVLTGGVGWLPLVGAAAVGALGGWGGSKLGEWGWEGFRDWLDQNRDGKFHIPKDPLVLDLDGDGIETVQTNGYQGAMFDHDKDGIQVATGWVAPDDGLLVIDKNGDGLINNGGELFGDNQVLKDGTLATTGYAALADYDSNGDKVIDSKDAEFADLRVWRDLNQDGTSQSNEWFTLAQLNIQSLDLEHQNVDKHLGNGKDNTKNACLKTLLVA